MKSNLRSVVWSVLLMVGSIPTTTFAQTWVGGAGVWSNPANWCGGLPNGGDVLIGNCNIGSASVVTQDVNATVGNLTIDSGNSDTVVSGKRLTINGSTISNAGTLTLAGTPSQGAQMAFAGSTVTLSGGGIFSMADAPNIIFGGSSTTLINQETIQGAGDMVQGGNFNMNNQGTVNANLTTPLQIRTTFGTMLNTGTLQASSGGTLQILAGAQGLSFNNTGGSIQALDASTVSLQGMSVSGGTLKTSGSGIIQLMSGTLGDLTNSGLARVGGISNNSANIQFTGTINNTGTIQLGSSAWGDDVTRIGGTTTLTGKGALVFANPVESIQSGSNGSPFLSNVDNLIEGGGTLGNGILALTNQKKGTILANQPAQLVLNLNPLYNLGKLQVNVGSTLLVTGNFKNFSGTTLTDGTYVVGGSFKFSNANIVTNAANIQLTSPTAFITNGPNGTVNALLNLSSNTKKGSLTIQGKQALTTNVSFTNAHNTTVKVNSSFTVGGSYTQTSGTTKVDGTLTSPTGFALQGGTLEGKGKIAAQVTSDAIVIAGDSKNVAGKLSIIGTGIYKQNSAGTLDIQIGGTAASKYSQLAVSNGVSLDGTLNVTLIKPFIPNIGDSFTILTSSARNGQFATVNGLSINSGEHFQITYTPTEVHLDVVSGP